MEALLNAIWLLLSVAAFGTWLVRWKRTPVLTGTLALVCMSVLLFPVISATDDLHPTPGITEEASRRMQRHAGTCASKSFRHIDASVTALLAPLHSPLWRLLWFTELFQPAIAASISSSSISGRAPPMLSSAM